MKRVLFGLAIGASAIAMAGCAGSDKSATAATAAPSAMAAPASGGGSTKAAATLAAKSGTNTAGRVTFDQQSGGVLVGVLVTGLAPGSVHGFHVHEKGDCSAPDGMSAGGHFNPGGKPHGQMTGGGDHHAGDMNNLTADASGNARVQFLMPAVTVAPGPNSVVGKAVIVHKDPDDYRTQPTGNAGGRIACGVIAAS